MNHRTVSAVDNRDNNKFIVGGTVVKKVELKVLDVTQGTMGGKPFFLILQEMDGDRKLSVMIGATEAQAILIGLRGILVPRPLLCDVYISTLDTFGIKLREVIIYKVEDGVYYSSLVLEGDDGTEYIDVRTSDAVALAVRYTVPIYTVETLMVREHIYEDSNGAISIPVSSVNVSVLKEALERAVKDENYELAAQLRDEIARRADKENEKLTE